MVQAKELRIGNWVEYNGNYFQWDLECFYDLIEETRDLKIINPIPLTPEILEKAGFVKSQNKNKDVWYKQFIRDKDELNSYVFVGKLKDDPKEMYYYGFESPISSVNINNIFHLHQLQNLYWILTGQELTISNL
jgi:hypothetical protein